jgi:PAS domain S-box-containing protein
MKNKVKCWDFFQCNETECPVYKVRELHCWLVSGTHCRNEIQGKFLEKMEMCLECEAFKANLDVNAMEQTLMAVNEQFTSFGKMVEDRDRELEHTSMELALGLSEVFEALREISSGNPEVRIPETSELALISKLKHMVNVTAENLGEIVDLSHEFAIGLAEHFDVLNRVSKSDLAARVQGPSHVGLLEALRKVTNEMIDSVYREITDRKRAEVALRESETRFRSVFENTGAATIIIEDDMTISMSNTEFEELIGYSKKQVEGKMKWTEYVAEEDLERMKEYHVKRRQNEALAPKGYEFRFVDKLGNIKNIYNRVGMIPGTKKSVAALVDITSLKRAEGKLEEMFTQMKKGRDDHLSILNMLRLGITTIEPGGRVTFLNQTALQLVGKHEQAVIGRHWEELFPFSPRDKARLKEILGRPRKAGDRLHAQVAFEDGRRYWMDMEVQDDPPNPERKILFLYDVSEIHDLRRMLEDKARFGDIVGKSKPMQSIYQRIQEVSNVDWTVLIEGATGTGKELVARAIHFSSHRKEGPFIAVNCAGLTDSLLTSQLFGHRRGAFTGAVEDHKGLFEVANGGTLLLDEIGDISKSMQTSLLRVLEEKEITRLGESTPRKIDVRILTSTHRDLSQDAENGHFRPDLLYRIRVARITLPLLTERREDMPLLIESFLGQSRAATGKAVTGVSEEAMRILLQYRWPGNVRELKSAIDFATLHCRESAIRVEDLPPEIVYAKHSEPPADTLYEDERQLILAALESAKGNRTVAARHLGISRATLYRRMAHLEINPIK